MDVGKEPLVFEARRGKDGRYELHIEGGKRPLALITEYDSGVATLIVSALNVAGRPEVRELAMRAITEARQA